MYTRKAVGQTRLKWVTDGTKKNKYKQDKT